MESKPNFIEIVRYLLRTQTQMELQAKTGVHQFVISQLSQGKPKPRISYEYGTALTKAYNEQLEKDKVDDGVRK